MSKRKIKGASGKRATRYKHGLTGTSFYYKWVNIENRCNRPSSDRYKNYGGRGIKLLWKSFDEFRKDMYQSYISALASNGGKDVWIERKDVDKGYSLSNCRWATRKEQMNNTTRNKFISYKGKTKTLTQWTEELGLDYKLVWWRLKRGWSFKDAVTKEKRVW